MSERERVAPMRCAECSGYNGAHRPSCSIWTLPRLLREPAARDARIGAWQAVYDRCISLGMEVGEDETGQDAVLRFVSLDPIAEPTARYCDMCNAELDRRQAPPKVPEFLEKMIALDEFDRVSALKISSLREPAATDELQCGHVSFDGSVCPKRLGHFGEHGYPEPAEPSRVEPESEPVRYKLIECARRLRKEQKRVADEGLTQSADEIAAVAFHIDEAAIALKRAPSPAPRWSITDAQMQVGDNLRPAPVGTQEDSPGRALDEEGYPIEPGGLPPGGVDLAKLKVWNAARAPVGTQGEPREGCHCFACDPNQQWRMILCARCGNKRCPHATDHRNSCTGSNEAGQPGSRYRARRIPPTSDPENPAREALKRALRALYVEGVQGGVEHAMDVARDRCAATAEMIAGSRGYARKEAADFFDAEWPAVGERCDWPALADVLAMLEAKPEQERAESNALDREKLRERIAELRGWADETNARWVKRYDVLALLDGAPGL